MNTLIISGLMVSMLSGNPYENSEIKEKKEPVHSYEIVDSGEIFKNVNVDVTAYSPTVGQTDSTPFTTASNKRVKEGYIAISRDLEDYLTFGDKVFIEDLGIFEVQDRMNRRWQARVDIFFNETKDAIEFGKHKKKMWILECQKCETSRRN